MGHSIVGRPRWGEKGVGRGTREVERERRERQRQRRRQRHRDGAVRWQGAGKLMPYWDPTGV